jgi:hypothetical protein
MGADNFIGVVSFNFKRHNEIICKYAIIHGQCPENYLYSLDKFREHFDLNTLYWTTSKDKIFKIARENQNLFQTSHGIITIDYTDEEPLENKIMYSSEYKHINGIKYGLYNGFTIILYILYLLFMYKMYSNLYY